MEGLRAADIEELVQAGAALDVSLQIRVLDAMAELPLEHDAANVLFRTVTTELDVVEPGTTERRDLLDIACRLPVPEARSTVHAVAHDRQDPDWAAAVDSLIAAHDADAIGPAVENYQATGAVEDLEALAALPLETRDIDPGLFDAALRSDDVGVRFLAAVAVARLGVTRPLAAALAAIDEVPCLGGGDPAMTYASLARLRPLPVRLQAWLVERLDDVTLPDRARVAVWALTAMADWEGTPLDVPEELDFATVEPVSEAELHPDLVPVFHMTPEADPAERFLALDDYAVKAIHLGRAHDPLSHVDYGNSVVRVAKAVPSNAVPVREVIAHALEDRTVLDRGQVGWVLARAEPKRMVHEIAPYLRGDIGTEQVSAAADLLKAAAEQLVSPTTPYRGGAAAPSVGPVASPRPVTPPAPREVWPRVDAPTMVAPGAVFDITVGLAQQAQEGVAATSFILPTYEVDVTLLFVFEGLERVEDEGEVAVLRVRDRDPLPALTIQLRALADPSFGDVRRIVVLYLIDGDLRGIGERAVAVGEAPVAPEEPGFPMTLQRDRAVAPVLTIVVWPVAGSADELQWMVVADGMPLRSVEHAAMRKRAPDREELANKVTALGDASMTAFERFLALRGIGKDIATAVPGPVSDMLRGAATVGGEPPTVLLLTNDAYVPWELAVFDPPVVVTSPSPFLGAQALVGRWVLSPSVASPCVVVPVATQALVAGDYTGLSKWEPLEHALREANDLAGKWAGSVPVDATFADVISLLEGAPEADVLHFSLHGKSAVEEVVDQGLVLLEEAVEDGKPVKRPTFLRPEQVRGVQMCRRPFVFLNACQVGKGAALLGDYAGLAAAFLKAGAAGVVAPLWKVDDELAAEVAVDFYDAAFGAGRPPVRAAAAVRAQRERFTRERAAADEAARAGTYLAYQFFGHPSLLLLKGRQDGDRT